MKLAGPEHPISITRNGKRVRVTFAGRTIADTEAALTLIEASYKPALYVPRADTDMSLLAPIARTKATPAISRSRSMAAAPKMLCGPTSSLTPQCQRSRNISRSIRIAWTRLTKPDALRQCKRGPLRNFARSDEFTRTSKVTPSR